MFFPEKIKNIKKDFRVLEIGPGGKPFHRSDVLLEKKFENNYEASAQRGFEDNLKTKKSIIYYEGTRFPFKDKEFDYVVCSQVLEHVDNIEVFLAELSRVAKNGYLEYPTVYYDYLYNFKVHKNFLLRRNGRLYWMKKENSGLNNFFEINKFFYQTLKSGHDQFIIPFKNYLFQGFEWSEKIDAAPALGLNDVCFEKDVFKDLNNINLRIIKDFLFFYKIWNLIKKTIFNI